MALENKLGLTSSADLAREEERISKKKALELFENGTIGHSGGTPDHSSRIVFSEENRIGVCVLTNMNVAASTDSLPSTNWSAQVA